MTPEQAKKILSDYHNSVKEGNTFGVIEIKIRELLEAQRIVDADIVGDHFQSLDNKKNYTLYWAWHRYGEPVATKILNQ